MRNIIFLKPGAKRRGGLEKYTARLANAFAERGDRVTLLTTAPALPGVPAEILPIFSKGPGPLRLHLFNRGVKGWLKTYKADLVLGLDRTTTQTHLRAGNGVHAAYLQSRLLSEGRLKAALCHINPLHRTLLSLEKEAFESPSLQRIITNSHMVKREILSHYRVDPEKIVPIHNGVEWDEFAAPFSEWEKGRGELLKKYHLSPEPLHLLFIANGYLRKGLLPLLEGLALLRGAPFHLSIVGYDRHLPFFRRKVAALSLEQKVTFFGPQGEIAPFYQMADLLLIPSFYDPFANVTLEALAMGLFVLSSRQNGAHEILNQETGSLFPSLTAEGIAETLTRALPLRKTAASAEKIRAAIAPLSLERQLRCFLDVCV